MKNKLFNINQLISPFLIFLILHFTFPSFCKSPKEKYLVTNSGFKINFTHIDSVGRDTLFYSNDKLKSFVLLDSIEEYCHTAPGRGGKGFIIGAITGLVTGAIIGALTAPTAGLSSSNYQFTNPYEKTDDVFGGAAGGLIVGGLIGLIIGANSGYNTDIDFKLYSKIKKQEYFNNIYLYNKE